MDEEYGGPFRFPDDYDVFSVICVSCEEWMPEDEAVEFDGEWFHPECVPEED